MVPVLLTVCLIAQSQIATHGDITVSPDSTGAQTAIRILNPTARPTNVDLNGAIWDAAVKPLPDALIATDPRTLTIAPYSTAPVKVQLTDATFFGTAKLKLTAGRDSLTVAVHRGLIPHGGKIDFRLGEEAGLEIENPGNATIAARWLLRTPQGDLCASRNCSQLDSWYALEIGPRRSARIPVTPQSWWFGGLRAPVSLVINYSGNINGVQQIEPVSAALIEPGLWAGPWIDLKAFFSRLQPLWQLLRTIGWLAVGAVLFFIANVMLANLQQYSEVSKRLGELRARVDGISGATASRTRATLKKACESMVETARGKLLSQNNQQQLALGLDAFERRIQLAEKLDAAYIKRNELRSDNSWPLSISSSVKTSLAEVERFVNGDVSAEDLARADKTLTAALDIDGATKALGAVFRSRLIRVQADFARELWKKALETLAPDFPSAVALLPIKAGDAEDSKVLDSDPAQRDLDLTQLEIIRDLVSTNAAGDVEDEILSFARLRSEPALLRARSLLHQFEDGITEEDIVIALRQKQWYAYCEPEAVRLGSTVWLWIHFSREPLNRCAARDGFACYWNLPDGTFEEGWEAYVVASSLPEIRIQPSFAHTMSNPPMEIEHVLDPATGEQVEMPVMAPQVTWPGSYGEWKYDVLELASSLLVPLITVAMIEFQRATPIGVLQLITVGFTSQLIQSKVLRKGASGNA